MLELKLLFRLATFDGEKLDLPDNEIVELCGGYNQAESRLCDLQEQGVVSIDGYEEEGFQGHWWLYRKDKLGELISAELKKLSAAHSEALARISDQEARLTQILGFNLRELQSATEHVEREIAKARSLTSNSETLAPLTRLIDELDSHFSPIKSVLGNFEQVYQGLIKPMQEQSKIGIRQTAVWAIISIVVSAAVSVLVTLFANGTIAL